MSVVHIDSTTRMEDFLLSEDITFVKFSAAWCRPCKMLEPHYNALAEEHNSVAAFASVDVEEVEGVADTHSVTALPTIVTFYNGKEMGRMTGSHKEVLDNFVEQAIVAKSVSV